MRRFVLAVLAFLIFGSSQIFSQAENVPVSHPVYVFLKRMEVKDLIERYRDAILPISRREIGRFLSEVDTHRHTLTRSETGWLDDFLSEFKFDISGSSDGFHSLIDGNEPTFGSAVAQSVSNREKFLYFTADSSIAIFTNALLDLDGRRIKGDALGSNHTEFLQLGGRIRGTLYGKLGFYARATNAQFWGSRELLERDPEISQSNNLVTADAQNFDFSEGHVRFDAGLVSLELGHERVLSGNGIDQKLVLSENARAPDLIRADFKYKGLSYTFMHAWILGTRSTLSFTLPFDSSYQFAEPTNADKYLASHRLGLSLPGLFEVGFQEIYIYSNRSVDLAYLNPFVLLESAQRARGERDNGLWAIDIKTFFLPGAQFIGTILFDDIRFGELFGDKWGDRHAVQVGFIYADPFTIPNTTLMVEYTRVEPWVFAHDRSRDNSYTSNGANLGPRIGPNAESWFLRLDWIPLRNLFLSGRVFIERKGLNVYDSGGNLIKNVGGDEFVPHRTTDSNTRIFLDGQRRDYRRLQLLATYEFVNQIWLDGRIEHEMLEDGGFPANKNTTVDLRLRLEF